MRLPRGRPLAIVGSTLAFALGLYLGREHGIWLMVGLGAAASLALCVWAEGSPKALRPSPARVAAGLAWGMAAVAVTHLVYPLVASALPALQDETRRLYRWLLDPPGPQAGAALLVVAVCAEEWVFRGLLVGELRGRVGRATLVGTATLVYVLPQLATGTWLLPAVALGLGLVWTLQRLLTDDLTVPLVTHLVWSVCLFSLLPLEG